MQSDIVQKLQPILRRNGWGNAREYARHIPFMLEREGLAIVETAEITRLTEAVRAAEEREKGLREGLNLAANRMDVMALAVSHENNARRYEWHEWAVAARQALAGAKP